MPNSKLFTSGDNTTPPFISRWIDSELRYPYGHLMRKLGVHMRFLHIRKHAVGGWGSNHLLLAEVLAHIFRIYVETN